MTNPQNLEANMQRLGTMNHPHGCTTEELMAAARTRFAEPAPILEDTQAMLRDLDNYGNFATTS